MTLEDTRVEDMLADEVATACETIGRELALNGSVTYSTEGTIRPGTATWEHTPTDQVYRVVSGRRWGKSPMYGEHLGVSFGPYSYTPEVDFSEPTEAEKHFTALTANDIYAAVERVAQEERTVSFFASAYPEMIDALCSPSRGQMFAEYSMEPRTQTERYLADVAAFQERIDASLAARCAEAARQAVGDLPTADVPVVDDVRAHWAALLARLF